MTAAAIELVGVVKAFGTGTARRAVLDGVDLAVAAGEIVAVAGRSGSGKTTLLTLVGGLEAPDAGAVRVLDRPAAADACTWAELAILPQSLGLLDELTVLENIALPMRLGAVPRSTEPADLMERMGIDHLADRFPSEVSLGEQQRTALARAAVTRPLVLLADEPISHQNRAWATVMMDLLAELSEVGTTCVLATHNELAFVAAHRVLELHAGRLQPLAR